MTIVHAVLAVAQDGEAWVSSVHLTRDGAERAMRGYVRENWSRVCGDEPMPADPEEARRDLEFAGHAYSVATAELLD
jgi:hypothetical protein